MIKETIVTEKFCDFCGDEENYNDIKTLKLGDKMEFEVHDHCAVPAVNHLFYSVAGWSPLRDIVGSIWRNWGYASFKNKARFK